MFRGITEEISWGICGGIRRRVFESIAAEIFEKSLALFSKGFFKAILEEICGRISGEICERIFEDYFFLNTCQNFKRIPWR